MIGRLRRRLGSLGLFVALVPWVVFTVISEHGSFVAATTASLAMAALIAVPAVLAGRPRLLELAAVASFVAFTAIAVLDDPGHGAWIVRYARAIAAGLLTIISFGSLLFTPFTEQYAREQVPARYWQTSEFRDANRRLTAMWGGVFAVMTASHVVAVMLDHRAGHNLFNWVIPVLLVVFGVQRSSAAKPVSPPAVATAESE